MLNPQPTSGCILDRPVTLLQPVCNPQSARAKRVISDDSIAALPSVQSGAGVICKSNVAFRCGKRQVSDGAADLSIVTHTMRHAFVCRLVLFPNHCCSPSFKLLLGYDPFLHPSKRKSFFTDTLAKVITVCFGFELLSTIIVALCVLKRTGCASTSHYCLWMQL